MGKGTLTNDKGRIQDFPGGTNPKGRVVIWPNLDENCTKMRKLARGAGASKVIYISTTVDDNKKNDKTRMTRRFVARDVNLNWFCGHFHDNNAAVTHKRFIKLFFHPRRKKWKYQIISDLFFIKLFPTTVIEL